MLKQAHIAAAMIALYGERAVFIDGRIDQRLTALADESGNIKAFFNRRFDHVPGSGVASGKRPCFPARAGGNISVRLQAS
ncbi:hypothetical protein GOE05_29745 [Sinorhizobium medicae]|nr:hypothetical protein [Sinorhizobium medicae]